MWFPPLILNRLKITEFVNILLKVFNTYCHNIIFKLIKDFVVTRIHFSLQRKSSDNNEKAALKSSRSVAMKMHVNTKHKIKH